MNLSILFDRILFCNFIIHFIFILCNSLNIFTPWLGLVISLHYFSKKNNIYIVFFTNPRPASPSQRPSIAHPIENTRMVEVITSRLVRGPNFDFSGLELKYQLRNL